MTNALQTHAIASPTSTAQRSAFTLVELLVVIGIIAVLIGILLPSLRRARLQAQSVLCESNLRQIGIGLIAYTNANKGALPFAGEDGDPAGPLQGPDNRGWASDALWFNAASKYVLGKTYDQLQLDAAAGGPAIPLDGNHHILVCPTAIPSGGVAVGTDADEMQDGYFLMHGYTTYPTAQEARKTFVCYAMNQKLFGSTNPPPSGKISHCKPAPEVVLVFEKRTNAGEVTQADDDYYNAQGGGSGKVNAAFLGRFKGDWKRLSTRHNKGGFLLLADGHVAFESLRDALTPPVKGVNDWNHAGGYLWNLTAPATK